MAAMVRAAAATGAVGLAAATAWATDPSVAHRAVAATPTTAATAATSGGGGGCRRCNSVTCESILEQNPGLTEACRRDPFLPRCNLACIDTTEDSNPPWPLANASNASATACGSKGALAGWRVAEALALDAPGVWVADPPFCRASPPESCIQPGNRRWIPPGGERRRRNRRHHSSQPLTAQPPPGCDTAHVDKRGACKILAKNSIEVVSFVGDSFLRNIFLGFVVSGRRHHFRHRRRRHLIAATTTIATAAAAAAH